MTTGQVPLLGAIPAGRLSSISPQWDKVASILPVDWGFVIAWAGLPPSTLMVSNGNGLYAIVRIHWTRGRLGPSLEMVKSATDPEDLALILRECDRRDLFTDKCRECDRWLCNCLWSESSSLEVGYTPSEGVTDECTDEPADDDPYWYGDAPAD